MASAGVGAKLAGALAKGARSCGLARGGQPCTSCPRRLQVSTLPCPLLDIEDASLSFLASRAAGPVDGVACRSKGEVALHSRTLEVNSVQTRAAPAPKAAAAAAGALQAGAPRAVPRSTVAAPAVPRTVYPSMLERVGGGMSVAPVRPLSGVAAAQSEVERVSVVIPASAMAHIAGLQRAAQRTQVEPAPAATPTVVPLTTARGKELFSEALHAGSAESFFPLAEQRISQLDASLAPAASLALVLNALGHDPHKVWKAPWRWNTPEVVLGSAATPPGAARQSPSLLDLAAMARMQGARAQLTLASARPSSAPPPPPSASTTPSAHASSAAGLRSTSAASRGGELGGSCAALRVDVARVCSDPLGDAHLVVHRPGSTPSLSQYMHSPPPASATSRGTTAGGEEGFAVVAGFHAASDMVLILDVAAARPPLAWVPLRDLHSSMQRAAGGGGGAAGGGWVTVATHAAHAAHAGGGGAGGGGAGGEGASQRSAEDAGLCPAMLRSWGGGEGPLPSGKQVSRTKAGVEASMAGLVVNWRCQRR
ncbi:hypothetical protein T484DRAFT_1893551, partial [Baffinella frigidus]